MKKNIKFSSHTRRKSASMKKIRFAFPLKKVSSKKGSHNSNKTSKNSLRSNQHSQMQNQNSPNNKERRVKFVPSLPSNKSIFSVNLKKAEVSIQNIDINHQKNESFHEEIHLKYDPNIQAKENSLNEDVIYKKLNNKMDDLLKLINSDEPSVSNHSSSSD